MTLTSRQWDVAGLVADGLTDRAIAARLGITERTVHATLYAIQLRLPTRPAETTRRAYIRTWVLEHERDVAA